MPFAATANLPDEVHMSTMKAQREKMMRVIGDAACALVQAKAKLASATGAAKEAAEKEVAWCARKANALKGMYVVETAWNDPDRADDTALGGFGCWGEKISDKRMEYRLYKIDSDGKRIAGSETRWLLCQLLQMGTNTTDTSSVVDAEKFFLMVADADGGNSRRVSFKAMTSTMKRYFPAEGFEQPKMATEQLIVSHRVAFVPVSKDTDHWQTEVRYVSFDYNTVDANDPQNLVFVADTTTTSVSAAQPAASHGFAPAYTKLMTSTTGRGEGDSEMKLRCFATSVKATKRSIKAIGTETAEESAAAKKANRGSQVNTGPSTLTPTSSSAWIITAPLKDSEATVGRRLNERVIYRSIGSVGGEDDAEDLDDGVAREDRARPGAPPKASSAKEACIQRGEYVEDAQPVATKSPTATGKPAYAMSVLILTFDAGTVIDDESLVAGSELLHDRHLQTAASGIEVADRLSQQAVDLGITTSGPLSKKAKAEIEQSLGKKIWTPGSDALPPIVPTGVPLAASSVAASD